MAKPQVPGTELFQRFFQGLAGGYQVASQLMGQLGTERLNYGRNVFYDPEFKAGLTQAGITAGKAPLAFAGAYATRLLGDISADETRRFYWRINNPLAIADEAMQRVVDPQDQLGPYGRGLLGLAAVQPAIALTGAYNPLNITELGRPTGYKQNIPSEEDPTKTTQPGAELFHRFFQGRIGRPLAFEKAKQEIPDLTKARYANYMNFLYNNPDPVGQATIGLVKFTGENLQGDPEARILGYPVSIPSVTALAGGIAGARFGVTSAPTVTKIKQRSLLPQDVKEVTTTRITPQLAKEASSGTAPRTGPALRRGLAGGAVGSAAGAMIGLLANQALAAKQTETQLPMN
jgi:hypothetical protein